MNDMAKRRAERLLTLSEIARRTGISMVSLRRYRTLYPERVPSVGEGRRQRFPAAALPVFLKLKEEGMARRGRGGSGGKRSKRSKRGGAKRAASARRGQARRSSAARRGEAAGRDRDSMLTLIEIGRRTGISYPTLLRYVRLYLDRLPHTGSGRKRRFSPAAVEEFKKLRSESRRGRRAAAPPAPVAPALTRQLEKLERGQRTLERQLRDLRKSLARPVRFRLER
jgi:DNA-binding transcriptional MerR regulator